MKYTIDYTQGLDGRWSARFRRKDLAWPVETPSFLTLEDCVAHVYDVAGPHAKLEVGDVRGEL